METNLTADQISLLYAPPEPPKRQGNYKYDWDNVEIGGGFDCGSVSSRSKEYKLLTPEWVKEKGKVFRLEIRTHYSTGEKHYMNVRVE